ncbi:MULTISPECIES: PQQ-binding-like beta-propeller repeat protein [unclassified Luteococcus]|uniref:PQQ-binding-like beta-propeller repeat protein n=1 Tax=unclassified Luteococcus TaxID=2639923 RepID=UPI00313C9C67
MTSPEPDEPSGYARPDGWTPLGEPGSSASPTDGLDARPIPEGDRQNPTAGVAPAGESTAGGNPEVTSRNQVPESSPGASAAGSAGTPGWQPSPPGAGEPGRSGFSRHPLRWAAWFSVLAVLGFLLVRPLVARDPEPDEVPDLRVPSTLPTPQQPSTPRPYPPSPLPSTATAPARPNAQPAHYAWGVQAKSLRLDLVSAELSFSPDGSADDDRPVIGAGQTWLVLTGEGTLGREETAPDRKIRLHGLDATTGRQRWQLDLPFGLCAREPLDGKVACASAAERDGATGLPTRWTLQLLDPATGRAVRTAALDGWFSMVAVQSGRFLLVEQAQPAPHLVVHAVGKDLSPAWRTDLSSQPLHGSFFSQNRYITRRDLTVPTGLALERVRIRQVDQMVALWGRVGTAFLNASDGRLVALPRCSRMVDDGQRIWCNDADGATAYSRQLKPLHRTQPGIRLAHPRIDRRHGDRSVPVFLNQHKQVVGVDPATGRTRAVIADTSSTDTFAGPLEPTAVQAGRTVLVDDAGGLVALDQAGSRAVWAVPDYTSVLALSHGERVLLGDRSVLDVVDPTTGRVEARFRDLPGFAVVGVGSPRDQAVVAVGLDGVWRLRLP